MRAWDKTYPSKAQLRLETAAMRQSILQTLLEFVKADNLEGVYAKGSSLKPWDSPLDYVPELSDVDVQVLLKDDSPLQDPPNALAFADRMERRFHRQIAKPLHLPRPQIQLLSSRVESYGPKSRRSDPPRAALRGACAAFR